MDLVERARLRAAVLGHTSAMGALAAHFGASTTRDARVRALHQVLASGSPGYAKVVELCQAYRIPLAEAGFWFTADPSEWRRIGTGPVPTTQE